MREVGLAVRQPRRPRRVLLPCWRSVAGAVTRGHRPRRGRRAAWEGAGARAVRGSRAVRGGWAERGTSGPEADAERSGGRRSTTGPTRPEGCPASLSRPSMRAISASSAGAQGSPPGGTIASVSARNSRIGPAGTVTTHGSDADRRVSVTCSSCPGHRHVPGGPGRAPASRPSAASTARSASRSTTQRPRSSAGCAGRAPTTTTTASGSLSDPGQPQHRQVPPPRPTVAQDDLAADGLGHRRSRVLAAGVGVSPQRRTPGRGRTRQPARRGPGPDRAGGPRRTARRPGARVPSARARPVDVPPRAGHHPGGARASTGSATRTAGSSTSARPRACGSG